jgi:predicted nucleotidyltransferase
MSERKSLPIYPGTVSSSNPKSAFSLDDFLRNWSDFAVRKPFIILVGSLANWEKTQGDIDILIKAKDPTPLIDALDSIIVKMFDKKEESTADMLIAVQKFLVTDSLFLNAKWRIERAFPDMREKMHILDDSFSGPFTNFVELSDLVSFSREIKIRQEMDSKKENSVLEAKAKKIELFQPIPLLKPLHGRTKGEIYSIDSVVDTIKSRKVDWFKANIVVQKKFDGVHCQADKKGDIVRIWTEEGREITKNCPTIAKELATLSSDDFKVIGEIELWKEDKHQNRAVTAGILNTKEVDSDEQFLVFNLFDCLYHKSRDIHMSSYSERLHHLKSFLFVKKELRVKLAETRIAKTESELRAALDYFSKLEGSEGAYLKKLDFPYSLSGKTTENIKFKNELSVDVQIVKVNIVGATTKK